MSEQPESVGMTDIYVSHSSVGMTDISSCHQATFGACCFNILKIEDMNFLPAYSTHLYDRQTFLRGQDAFHIR